MRVTTALLLRDLLSKLHPPSPATPRESQQLLRLLDTSFRDRLDEIHPSPRAASEAGTSDSIPLGSSRAANLLIDSVLHHPLLESRSPKAKPLSNGRLWAVTEFENALRDGKVSHAILQSCSSRYLEKNAHGVAAPSTTLLGTKIAAWLSSASDTSKEMFFTDTNLLRRIVHLMYVDGLEEVVWTWLSMLYQRDWFGRNSSSFSDQTYLDAEDVFISVMIQASMKKRAYEDAVHQFVKASEYRASSTPTCGPEGGSLVKSGYRPLFKSWRNISAMLLFERKQLNLNICPSSFDNLLKYGPSCLQSPIGRGVLMLYHPEKRSSKPLFHELQNKKFRKTWLAWFAATRSPLQKTQLPLLLDAAELSIHHKRAAESQFFLDFAQTLEPDMVISTSSSSPAKRLVRMREEVEAQVPNSFALT